MEFLEGSKQIIEKHKLKKRLTDIEIKKMVDNQKVLFNDRCPRCQGLNNEEIVDFDVVMSNNVALERKIHSWRCRVCGYNPFKNKALNWKMRLRKLWHKDYWVEVK